MKIRDLACVSCAIAMLATPGHAGCEKWKSEIMSLVGASAKYYDAYMDYRSGDIELGSFQSKASKAVASIDEVTERLNTIASCAGFEGRADKVAAAIRMLRPAMIGLEVIEPLRQAAFSE